MRSRPKPAAAFPSCASHAAGLLRRAGRREGRWADLSAHHRARAGTRFFIVADMGGWDPKKSRLLLLDPAAPEWAHQSCCWADRIRTDIDGQIISPTS